MSQLNEYTPHSPASLVAEPAQLLADLVRIDSVNPDLVPGGGGEAEIAGFIGTWLEEHGFETTRLEQTPGRPSIVAIARGTGGGQNLMFNGHIDTVTLAGYEGDPLDPRIQEGRMYGRGTYDMKAGLAAQMIAAATAAQEPHSGDIILALVADEEFGSKGTAEVLEHFSADAAIVSEPTNDDLAVAHGGFVWFDVTIHGIASHGSLPDKGIDAIVKAGPFLAAVGQLARRLSEGQAHDLIGPGSIHASLITGGEELSSYPAECRIALERRTVPGETADQAEEELREILNDLAVNDPDFRFSIDRTMERSPFEIPVDSAIASLVSSACEAVTGRRPTVYGKRGWTDCALLQEAGIPAVLYGVAGGGAHSAIEWIEVSSLDRVTRTLAVVTAEFCR
ncbi:ArgE/DapE family deacylase [Paenarthrobacter sp. NPDC090522]|uniref:ArgE/DapE family deacylase n=1 Tax=Paenarthrobacter sp. NPDC090522 TaxID=3364383 RepID=UPI00381C0FC0